MSATLGGRGKVDSGMLKKFFFGHSNDFGLASTMKQCDRFYHEAL